MARLRNFCILFIYLLSYFIINFFFCLQYGVKNNPPDSLCSISAWHVFQCSTEGHSVNCLLSLSYYALVKTGCPLSPKDFELNLPQNAQLSIKQIQNQSSDSESLIVASPSMLSSTEKDTKCRKEDGVICDLILFNERMGGLHLLTLVESGSKEKFLPLAHDTGKAVKKSLVINGGCFEKFYISCHVVSCDTVRTEPLDKLCVDDRYPSEYHLASSPTKIITIFQSLVKVLAQVPSFLSNKQGVSFLNLLTKEQFGLLHHMHGKCRELWINGVAGTGKTVVAVEFIRELRRRDHNLGHENILYVCENLGILHKIRYSVFFLLTQSLLDNRVLKVVLESFSVTVWL